MKKIPCGGFYVDDRLFYFIKDEETGKPILCASEDAIRGVKGDKGDKGDPFTINKIYPSIDAMTADHENKSVLLGSFVLIENEENPQDVDNGKLYVKGEHGFDYITNLSGAQGLKGEKGDTGDGVPHGGEVGEVLMKSSEADYATHWQDISDNLLPAITEEEDNGKIAQVVNGKWTASYLEHGQIVYANSTMNVMNYNVPRLTAEQTTTIYNAYIAGKNVVISSIDGKHHYHVISVDGSDADNITAKVLYEDKIILTYNKFGVVGDYTPLLDKDAQVVALSREYGTAQNDHGYYREWTPNPQGKIWVECGVFIKTVALSVGSNVPLPAVFEDGNFHVQVTVMEMGNYSAKAYRSGNNRSINVLVTDYYGTPKAVNICVEAKGWKA